MQTKIVLLMISCMVGLLTTTPAFAILSDPYGWYFEVNGGYSHVSNLNKFGTEENRSGPAANINAGYKFMPYFATEIGASYYSRIKVKDFEGTTAAYINNYSWGAALKGIVPIECTGLELFAKLGFANVVSNPSIKNYYAANSIGLTNTRHTSAGPWLGVGAQYYFWPEFAGVIQWQRADGNSKTGTFDFYSIGFSYIVLY